MKLKGRKRNISKANPGVARRAPLRTCVACQRTRPKRELIRLVRTVGGDIEFDVAGKMEGRGAYSCPARECVEKVVQGKQLERALKHHLAPADRERLLKNSREILKEISG